MTKCKAVIRIVFLFGLIPLCFFLTVGLVWGQSEDVLGDLDTLDEQLEFLQAETYVITASRISQSIKKTASSISVVTSDEIERMGARNLMDVLKRVPGISWQHLTNGQYHVLDVRGMVRQYSQNVLLMIDSQPYNSNYFGSATWTLDTLAVDNVKRIEVIRGPGSSMYGANAFAGVVNVITKDGEDIDGVKVSGGYGDFETVSCNLMYGEKFGEDLSVALNANYFDSEGFEAYFEKDYQTGLDQMFGTSASRAPGYANADDNKTDFSLNIKKGKFYLDGRYIARQKDLGVALGYTLNDVNRGTSIDYGLVLGYENPIKKWLNLNAKLYHNHNYLRNVLQAIPPGGGIMTPDGPAIAAGGVRATAVSKNNRNGMEIQADLKPWENNTIVTGVTFEEMRQYDVEYYANFLYTPVQNLIIPLPSRMNLSDEQNYNKEVSRTFTAFFLEDIWDIRDNLRFNFGGRYDYYSDFGGSFNPRGGLVWEFIKGYDLKLIYGRAFRAPSFYELYNENNPSLVGNPDLSPETVDTYEISLGAVFSPKFSSRITGFYNYVDDVIDSRLEGTKSVLKNVGEISTKGVEVETKWEFWKDNSLSANFTYQKSENEETGEEIWDIPTYKGNVMATLNPCPYAGLFFGYHFQGGFQRQEGDPRDDHSSFGVLDATLIIKDLFPSMEGLRLRASVYNLLDEDYSFPTPVDTLESGYPMPGINYFIGLTYKF